MREHLVCLTVDVDNTSAMLARGMTQRGMLSRGDFGAVGTQRLLSLFEAFGIKTTWFVPGHTIESYPKSIEAICRAGHEIAAHGWTHRQPARLSVDEEAAELLRAKETIQNFCGHPPKGYRAPSWEPSWNTTKLLAQHGFAYDSSLMANDYMPYYPTEGDVFDLDCPIVRGPPSQILEFPVSPSLDDFSAFETVRYESGFQPGLRATSDVLENWLGDFDYMARHFEWGVLTYVVHPHVIGRGHRMLFLEKLIRSIVEKGGRFVPMAEAAQSYERFRQRISAAD